MKKFLLFALILCMTSCIVNSDEPCTCTPGTSSKTITIKVKASDWQYSDQGYQFSDAAHFQPASLPGGIRCL